MQVFDEFCRKYSFICVGEKPSADSIFARLPCFATVAAAQAEVPRDLLAASLFILRVGSGQTLKDEVNAIYALGGERYQVLVYSMDECLPELQMIDDIPACEDNESKRRKLAEIIHRCRAKIFSDTLSGLDLSTHDTIEALKKLHVVHALGTKLELPLPTYSRLLKLSFTPSGGDDSLERCVLAFADMAVKHHSDPEALKQKTRELGGKLSFKQRSDFRNALASCFGHLWKGGADAA